jgi:transcriptional regulator with XRE-family HTH domain
MLLGEKISRLRKSRGLSQELLAENSGISLRTLQRIEAGTTTPRPYIIKTLADVFNVPVEELTTTMESIDEQRNEAIAKLRQINFSALSVLLIPFSNILLTVFLWKKNNALPLVNVAGRKIISFQLLWTLGALFLLFLIPVIQYSIAKSYVIGRLPPTVVIVYITLLILNVLCTIRAAWQLQKGEAGIYSFVPLLF